MADSLHFTAPAQNRNLPGSLLLSPSSVCPFSVHLYSIIFLTRYSWRFPELPLYSILWNYGCSFRMLLLCCTDDLGITGVISICWNPTVLTALDLRANSSLLLFSPYLPAWVYGQISYFCFSCRIPCQNLTGSFHISSFSAVFPAKILRVVFTFLLFLPYSLPKSYG